MDPIKIGSVMGANGLLINVYATEDASGVHITLDVASGYADLRGFFLDWADMPDSLSNDDITGSDVSGVKVAEEGVTKLSSDTNMNGTGETFDMGVMFGSAGIGKDDIGETSFSIAGITLDDLDGVTFGLRLMSTGENREGSEKLLGVLDVPEPPPVDHFPGDLPKDISHVVLYFDGDGDAIVDVHNPLDFTIKIDNWIDDNALATGDDVDNYLPDILDHIYNDPTLLSVQSNLLSADLLGASIKAGNVDAGGYNNFYALDGNPNDVDAFPSDYNDGTDVGEIPPFDVTNPGPNGDFLVDGDPIENTWITYSVDYVDVFPAV